jgi:hypothetical protein
MKKSATQTEKAKRKAALAIDTILRAAKQLAEAEQTYYGRKPKAPRKRTVLDAGGTP